MALSVSDPADSSSFSKAHFHGMDKVELVLIREEGMLFLGRQKAAGIYYRSLCDSEI